MVSAGLSVVRSTKPGYFPEWLLNIPFLVAVFRSQIKTDPSPDWSPLEEIYSIFFFLMSILNFSYGSPALSGAHAYMYNWLLRFI